MEKELNLIPEGYNPKVYEKEDGRYIVFPDEEIHLMDADNEPFKFKVFALDANMFKGRNKAPDEESIERDFKNETSYVFQVNFHKKIEKASLEIKNEIRNIKIVNAFYEDSVPMLEGVISIPQDMLKGEKNTEIIREIKDFFRASSVCVLDKEDKAFAGEYMDVDIVFPADKPTKNCMNTLYRYKHDAFVICQSCGKVKTVSRKEMGNICHEKKDANNCSTFFWRYTCGCGSSGSILGHSVTSNEISGIQTERITIREDADKSPRIQIEQDYYTLRWTYPKEAKDEWYLSKTLRRDRYTFNTCTNQIYYTIIDRSFRNGKVKNAVSSPRTIAYDGYNYNMDIKSEKNKELLGKIFGAGDEEFTKEWFFKHYSFRHLIADSIFNNTYMKPAFYMYQDSDDEWFERYSKKYKSFRRLLGTLKDERYILNKAKPYPRQIRKKIYKNPTLLFYLNDIKKTGIENMDILNMLVDFIINYKPDKTKNTNPRKISTIMLDDIRKEHGEKTMVNMFMSSINADPHTVNDTSSMYNKIKALNPGLLLALNGKSVLDIKDWKKLHDELSIISNKLKTEDLPITVPERIREKLEFENEDIRISFPESTHRLVEIGGKMSICVGSSNYQEGAALGNRYIMAATEKSTGRYIACIEIGRDLSILQLKGYHNGLIEEKYRKDMTDWVDRTEIERRPCNDVSRNKATPAAIEAENAELLFA